MAAWTMYNGVRLHWDSILLFKERSYSSSLALSILAMEEIAKAHLLEDIVFHAHANEWDSEYCWQFIKDIFFSHRWKQASFAHHLFPFHERYKKGGTLRPNRFVELAQSGQLERMKQDSFYVGLSRRSLKNSRIRGPHKIPRSKPLRMITLVNDYLLDLCVGHLLGYYALDSEYIMDTIKPKFVRQLETTWKFRGRKGKVALRRFKLAAAG